ncbi:EAL domain-containing protein [Pseudomonas sp. RIT-PI-S]|uniref:EAL domain-containing protein n=1 Tax=Pseudomonas sp. RIT-PI-S TaxID=3035295 RepID=UPI0021DAC33E|nr:EAL domain-containing protein [Pseudomonas sp. RIT-PI-S]
MALEHRSPGRVTPVGRALDTDFSASLAVERTRLLYQGSLVPTLLMLLTGLVCSWILWTPGHHVLVSAWLTWLMTLVALRVIQVAAFDSAMPNRQAALIWRRMFLLGSAASGLTLAGAAILLAPFDSFLQQAWIFGLLGAAALSASIAYAVSFTAFLSFVVPCLGPPIAWLFLNGGLHQRGWAWLGLALLASLCVVAWQVNRLIERSLLRRFQNQALIASLREEQAVISRLNREMTEEMERRRAAEQELRAIQAHLEEHVAQRSRQLDQANQALSKSQARLALALEASELGLWDWDLRTDEVHHTELERLFGIPQQDTPILLKHLRPRLHPDDLPALKQTLIAHLKGRTDDYRVEYRIRHSDGRWLWVEDRGRAVERTPGGRVLRMLGTRRDITRFKRQEEQQRLAATVFEAMSEGIVVLDPEFVVLAINQAFTHITGYTPAACVGEPLLELPCSRDLRRQFPQIHQALLERGGWQGEVVEARHNGELYPQWLQVSAIIDEQGALNRVVVFCSDLSSRRASEERLHYLTYHDELTGLGNRGLFRQRLHDACQRLRHNGRSLALLHIDLDRFKLLNDSFGHDAADIVLRQIAKRIGAALPEADTVARLAGDEFAVLFDAYTSLSSLIRVTTRLLAKIRVPLRLDDHELIITASIGISLLPDTAREGAVLLNQADIAMQQAKRLGGDGFQFYTESMQADAHDRLQLEHQLRRALELRQLEVFYQPKLDLASDTLGGVEALVRWRHPQRGLIAPDAFIELAEETGQITAIGEFVLRTACRQAREWQRNGLGDLRISVNLSGQQLRYGNLVSLVRQVLAESGLAPTLLELELTESQWLDNISAIHATFAQLRELGVKLAIDDFGTGYSALSYLKRLPVDYVKLDQAFVCELGESTADAAITQAVITMAHGLGLKVTAEGVETAAQLQVLQAQGCDEVQGYLVGRPVPAAEFQQWLVVRGNEGVPLV